MLERLGVKMYKYIGFLLVGTGGMLPMEGASQWQNFIEQRSPLMIEKISSSVEIDVRTPKEHLENIRAVFNPPMAELANLFGVSRQAIYKWLAQDTEPEKENFDRIKTLSKIADIFKEAKILRLGFLLNMKNSDGLSLFDLLKNNKPHEKHIEMLIAEAKIMDSAYDRSGLAQSNSKPTDDWISSISLPTYPKNI